MDKVNWMQKFTDGMDLPGELPPGVPVIEIAKDCRVLIERHRGMTEYSRERIRVRVCFGIVCICGSGLELSHMSRDKLVISGQIDAVQIERRKIDGCF